MTGGGDREPLMTVVSCTRGIQKVRRLTQLICAEYLVNFQHGRLQLKRVSLMCLLDEVS